jgi:predicted nucleotidyltransferase
MSQAEAKKIVRKYAKKLEENKYSFSAIYLFGSFGKGKPHKWSDIDIAVVSKELDKNWDQARFKLWELREEIDDRIEPHGFSPEDFKNDWDPMVYEIKKTGVRIR